MRNFEDEDEDDDLFELEELDLEEEDDDAPETKRRAHEFRPVFVMQIGSCTTEDEIKAWRERKVATFSENGSTVTTGQSYKQRGEGASVEEQKCHYVHRLGCPFKLKTQRYIDKVVILVCDDLGHVHDMDADRSRKLKAKYAEVL